MTTKAFVIGHPIAHSRSPLIHGKWLAEYGIDGHYEIIDVAPAQLSGFFERLRKGEFAGGNVTIPHKQAALSLCDSIDPLARSIGAVNTLIVRDGNIHGINTDYMGFLDSLDARVPDWDNIAASALVLGAGGAARAILLALADRNIPVILLNRTRETAEKLACELGGNIEVAGFETINQQASRVKLVINTTSIGMYGSRFKGFDPGSLQPDALVTDIVYMPLITPLLADAATRGLKIVDGLDMLLYQAAPGFLAWFGIQPAVTPALRQYIQASLEA